MASPSEPRMTGWWPGRPRGCCPRRGWARSSRRWLADAPDSPSLIVLRDWLGQWEEAGRPAPATYTPTLVRTGEGWDLRLSR
ncbi:hypothetical protein FHS42_001014 [Streptomyces zagrosensis]|uniref:Uncharacterized protein n=1 Tax=Streptomyces zagrosensis TaxID=1042984 RepID=A0A7W9Q6F3_9ACTN|nr:hypothetical protein [Streptomyces zagrosensis]